MKNIMVYTNSSFGGIFEYSIFMHKAYIKNELIDNCIMVYPKNAKTNVDKAQYKLITDKPKIKYKIFKKIHFIYRSIINPIIFLSLTKSIKPDLIIFNDFDQVSSLFWTLFYKCIKTKKAIWLHDPDRDKFFKWKWLSELSMISVMKIMDFACYHESLSEKNYYKNKNCRFINIPHGIYETCIPDEKLSESIKKQKSPGNFIISIPGNIRYEKNYHLAIEAISHFPEIKLIIAGSASNSNVDIQFYKNLINELKVEDQIIWIDKYLDNNEMAAIISESDAVMLYYSKTFTSQSGILNMVIPYKKKLLISNTNSALTNMAIKFSISIMVNPDNTNDLINGLKQLLYDKNYNFNNYDSYLQYASWETMGNISISNFFNKNPENANSI